MDFNKFRAGLIDEFGLTDEDLKEVDKAAILLFKQTPDGKVISRHNGKAVLKHRDSENEIMAGDLWICSLDSRGTYYFAKGLMRIDSSFMLELKKEQMDEIVACVWEKHRDMLMPDLEKKYEKILEEEVNKAREQTRNLYVEDLDNLSETVLELERKDTENKKIIASLQNQLDNCTVETKTAKGTAETSPPAFSSSPLISVRRDSPDKISSDSFNRSRYSVHLSADLKIILVTPNDQGNVVCMNNTIELNGLALISPFSTPYEMVSEYDPKRGGIRIYLRGTPE